MYNTGIYSTPFLVLKGMADVPAGGYFFTGTKGPKFFIRSERSKRPDHLDLRFYNPGKFILHFKKPQKFDHWQKFCFYLSKRKKL